jgi:hypothetical protein
MSQTRQFIDQLATGEASAAKETLENMISVRAFEALDSYKKEMASSIFGGVKEAKEEETNESEEVEQIEEKEGYGGSDPLANRASYAKKHGTGQVYKKTYPGDKVGMTKAFAYDLKRSGPKGKLPEEVEVDKE